MVHWVILRNIADGTIVRRWAFKTAREAERKKYGLEQLPDPKGITCRIELQVLWHPEQPR
jgi:hypothetical protein